MTAPSGGEERVRLRSGEALAGERRHLVFERLQLLTAAPRLPASSEASPHATSREAAPVIPDMPKEAASPCEAPWMATVRSRSRQAAAVRHSQRHGVAATEP